ncbi:hypothetical protein FJZ31_39035 [Candidatus Poribacteria bacterium]|nr:hypothetical protein [Candidatus Poribacteria bacterium]
MSEATINLPYAQAQMRARLNEKKMLAEYVAKDLIKPETTVFLDAGSTIQCVGQAIFEREYREKMKLCIMTNNMMIFQNFNKCLQDGRLPANHSLSLVLTGGEYDMQHDALFGCIAVASLEAIKCHTSIIGTSGITLEKGGGPHSHALTAEKVIKEAIFKKKVEHRIIVCDHTKLGREDSLLCGKIEDIVKDADKCTIVIGCPCAADFVMHKIGYILEEVLTEEDKQKQISGKISSVWDKGDWSPETYNQIKEILSGVLTEEGMKEYI